MALLQLVITIAADKSAELLYLGTDRAKAKAAPSAVPAGAKCNKLHMLQLPYRRKFPPREELDTVAEESPSPAPARAPRGKRGGSTTEPEPSPGAGAPEE